jgi:hypothetical protein
MAPAELSPWRIGGTYLESCNCEAICPCRKVGGRKGGRSTYGVCMGALSWGIERGGAGAIDLAGLNVAIALRYDDDEPGSPWDFLLYLDERADERQRDALEAIFLGRLGGTPDEQFPWVWKPSRPLGVRAASIEIDHAPRRGWFRAGTEVSVRVGEPVDDPEPVTCVIPGHDRGGSELHGEAIEVSAPPLEFRFDDRCAYRSTFDYSSDRPTVDAASTVGEDGGNEARRNR